MFKSFSKVPTLEELNSIRMQSAKLSIVQMCFTFQGWLFKPPFSYGLLTAGIDCFNDHNMNNAVLILKRTDLYSRNADWLDFDFWSKPQILVVKPVTAPELWSNSPAVHFP